MSGGYPPGCTQWHVDYAAGGYDEEPPEYEEEPDYDDYTQTLESSGEGLALAASAAPDQAQREGLLAQRIAARDRLLASIENSIRRHEAAIKRHHAEIARLNKEHTDACRRR